MSSAQAARSIAVVVGVGNGAGTGASSARIFSKAGYHVAVIARGADGVNKVVEQVRSAGGEALALPVSSYSYESFTSAFSTIKSKWPEHTVRVAVFNAGAGVWKNFLSVTEEDIRKSVDTNIVAAFAFSREAILAFQNNSEDSLGKKGTLIFTGATAATRGNKTTSAFAAGKFGLRALSQSLAKEFGSQDIHVAHAIIDGGIETDRSGGRPGPKLDPDSIAKSYLALAHQDKSAWTWELDLRPSHENW